MGIGVRIGEIEEHSWIDRTLPLRLQVVAFQWLVARSSAMLGLRRCGEGSTILHQSPTGPSKRGEGSLSALTRHLQFKDP